MAPNQALCAKEENHNPGAYLFSDGGELKGKLMSGMAGERKDPLRNALIRKKKM